MKKPWDSRNHGTLKSGVSQKWFGELSRLIEWFLCTESDGYPLSYQNLLFWACIVWHRFSTNQIVRYFKLKKRKNYMRYQVEFLLPLKLQKYPILGYVVKYSWPISLQDFLLLLLLVNLNNGGSLLHCICWFGKMWIGFEANHGDT